MLQRHYYVSVSFSSLRLVFFSSSSSSEALLCIYTCWFFSISLAFNVGLLFFLFIFLRRAFFFLFFLYLFPVCSYLFCFLLLERNVLRAAGVALWIASLRDVLGWMILFEWRCALVDRFHSLFCLLFSLIS